MDVKQVLEVDARQRELGFRTKKVEIEQASEEKLEVRSDCPWQLCGRG